MYPVVLDWITTGHGWGLTTKIDLDRSLVIHRYSEDTINAPILGIFVGTETNAELKPEYQHKSIEEIKIMLEMRGLRCT